jgi:hypothetical protein
MPAESVRLQWKSTVFVARCQIGQQLLFCTSPRALTTANFPFTITPGTAS